MKAASRNGNSRRERVQGACHHGKCCAAGGKCVRSGMGQRKPMGVSGGCATGCAVQGGEEAGCEEGALRVERAATAEERAVCMACCSGAAPRIRAQPRAEMMGGKLLGSAAQPGAGCGVRCTRSPATGAGCVGAVCEGAVCAADAISAAPPWCSVVVGRGHGCGQRTERGDSRRGVPRQLGQ